MTRWPNLVLLTGVALLCQACAGTMPPGPDSAADGAMRIHRDPATGAFTAPAPGTLAASPADVRVSSSSEALVESQGTSAAGGIRLDLNGKFRSYAIATKDEQGKVTVRCEPSAPKQP